MTSRRLRSQRVRVVVVRAQQGRRREHGVGRQARVEAEPIARCVGDVTGCNSRRSARLPALLESAFGDVSARPKVATTDAELTSALAELMDAVAADQPTAVLIDDMHWADGSSRQVIQAVTTRLTSAPLRDGHHVARGRRVAGEWSGHAHGDYCYVRTHEP
ncbi:MAG: ATP-binding protein [Gemmatimonadaceae bacterium]